MREINVNEDRDPRGDGEEDQGTPNVVSLPEYCVEAVGGAPECPDGVAGEIDVDGRTYDEDDDNGVKSG